MRNFFADLGCMVEPLETLPALTAGLRANAMAGLGPHWPWQAVTTQFAVRPVVYSPCHFLSTDTECGAALEQHERICVAEAYKTTHAS